MKIPERFAFFLNPYRDVAFTRCPKCEGRTKQRKLPLVISFEKDERLLSLNKTCRFCPYCDLIIARKDEIDRIASIFTGRPLGKEKYLVVGTQERPVWRTYVGTIGVRDNALEGVSLFKNVWIFAPQAGWVPARRREPQPREHPHRKISVNKTKPRVGHNSGRHRP